ncbi:Sec-independent protein translocase protein TatB [soil metagenome]
MIDLGFDKIALIGAVALIVVGPERLPRVARTVGHLLGKAQRYVSDVKAEVNRSIELDELRKMKGGIEDAAREVHQSVQNSVDQTRSDVENAWSLDSSSSSTSSSESTVEEGWLHPSPQYRHPGKKWRLKRGAIPQWYKHSAGIRGKVQSGAARVARHRPR